MACLKNEKNPFGGCVVGAGDLPTTVEEFALALPESIQEWRADGIRVVWLELPIERAAFVPIAVDAGFVYHHATEKTLQLTLALVDGSFIPPFATHYIGAGGVVIDDDRNLLVIQERHHTRKHYKLPGGALQPGEHIAEAAIREVKEETGIDTEFLSLVCFRHWHGYRYGKSDIYFVTRLRPLSTRIRLDETEIAECFWMPVDEYLDHPDTHVFNRRIVQAAVDAGVRASQLVFDPIDGYGTPATHEIFMPDTRERV